MDRARRSWSPFWEVWGVKVHEEPSRDLSGQLGPVLAPASRGFQATPEGSGGNWKVRGRTGGLCGRSQTWETAGWPSAGHGRMWPWGPCAHVYVCVCIHAHMCI